MKSIIILYNMWAKIVVIIHGYETRAIFVLFVVHQDTESE